MTVQRVIVQAGDDKSRAGDAVAVVTAHSSSPAPPRPWRHVLRRCFFLFGLASLCYILGAMVSFFDLPTSSFLHRAFVGGMAWYEVKRSSPRSEEHGPLTKGHVDKPDKTCDGFTLCMCGGTRAVLANMHGEVIHEWQVPFSKIWPDPPHRHGRTNDDAVYFVDGHLYPNGDLLVVMEGPADLRNSSSGN